MAANVEASGETKINSPNNWRGAVPADASMRAYVAQSEAIMNLFSLMIPCMRVLALFSGEASSSPVVGPSIAFVISGFVNCSCAYPEVRIVDTK